MINQSSIAEGMARLHANDRKAESATMGGTHAGHDRYGMQVSYEEVYCEDILQECDRIGALCGALLAMRKAQ